MSATDLSVRASRPGFGARKERTLPGVRRDVHRPRRSGRRPTQERIHSALVAVCPRATLVKSKKLRQVHNQEQTANHQSSDRQVSSRGPVEAEDAENDSRRPSEHGCTREHSSRHEPHGNAAVLGDHQALHALELLSHCAAILIDLHQLCGVGYHDRGGDYHHEDHETCGDERCHRKDTRRSGGWRGRIAIRRRLWEGRNGKRSPHGNVIDRPECGLGGGGDRFSTVRAGDGARGPLLVDLDRLLARRTGKPNLHLTDRIRPSAPPPTAPRDNRPAQFRPG